MAENQSSNDSMALASLKLWVSPRQLAASCLAMLAGSIQPFSSSRTGYDDFDSPGKDGLALAGCVAEAGIAFLRSERRVSDFPQ
ncbi:hypothetical protein GCM10008094_02790 [Aidingimonas halophila]|nr:hypothetical protein GCM10008094_02790 [Aidingimonas halophila]